LPQRIYYVDFLEVCGDLPSARPGLRFTGFVAFAVRIGSLLTGLAFSIIVARRLSEEDFGAWAYVGRFVSYFAATASFVSFWAGRDAGRGRRPLKTALVGSGVMVVPLSLAYLAFVGFSAHAIGRESWVVVLGLMQLPVLHLLNTADGVSYGHRPTASAYAFAAFEVVKLFLAFLMVHLLGLGLFGVFASISIAQLVQLLVLVYLQKDVLGGLNLGDFLRWLKGFAIPLLGFVNGFVYGLDVFLGGVIYGSALPLSYWQAALSIALVVSYYNNLVVGLYPALLSGGGSREVEKIFRFAMMLGTPLLFGALFLGRDLLLLLRPAYAEAAPVLYVLAVSYWIGGLGTLFSSIVGGKEEVDRRVDVSFLDYVKSKLFRYTLIALFLSTGYVTAFSVITVVARAAGWGPVDTAYSWSFVHLGMSVASVVVGYLFSKGRVVFRIPWKSLAGYLGASVLMVSAMCPLHAIIPPSNTAIPQLVRVSTLLLVGVTTYLGTVLMLDREGRAMVKLLITKLGS
jgi:O-antigen/teichoic acid export membrane protein